jgi:glycosyltransferase involved in cell wall biosynthesis
LTTLHSSAALFLDRTDFWGRPMAWVYREMLERTSRVQTVACSNQVAESFRATDIATGELAVVENGIDLSRIRSVGPEVRQATREELGLTDEFVCLTVARLSAEKGHAALVEAASRFGPEERIVFLFVGGGEMQSEIESRIRAAGLGERVRVLGHRSDIPQLLQAADLFVLPSRWEGRPLSLMEAYAAGLPVVATDVGGVGEMLQPDQGTIVRPDDAEALHDAIERYLRAPLARVPVLDGRTEEMDQRFDVRSCVGRYEALYETLLAGAEGLSRAPARSPS